HVVGLCPTIDPPDLYADKEDEHFLYYHLRDGNHTFRRGLEKRHELWIDPSGVMAEETALMATQRVLATAPAEWYADSAALGDILPSEGDRIGIYDRIVDGNIGAYGKRRDDSREFGLMNYGDWYGERGYNWGNLEYDTHHGFLTQYLRSGDTRFLIEGEIAARHNMDIDVIHHAEGQVSPPEWSGAKLPGQVWVHSMGHTGGYYPPEYLDMNVYAQGYATNRGHIWSQGMWEYSLLTGDTRAWECAKLVSDWAAGPQTTNFRFGNQREPGWMTILVMAAYRATGDPYYLNAARIMIDKVYEERDASPMPESGLRYRELVPGHCTCEEHHWGAAGFMAGVLMTGMKMYYQETGDEEVAENIVKIARFCVDTMYEEDAGLFRYTSCPNSSQSASYGFILGNGIGFAANYADDDSLRTVVRDYLVRTMASFQGIGGGKTIGFYMCFAPYALSEVAKFPGESFDAYMAREVHRATSPGLRRLPGLVPNPDFEIDVAGWQKRGGTMTLDGEDPHSGASCAKIEGRFDKANEYITTVYGTPGEWQISWLVPRKEYRLSTWLKVESITDGAPAPDIRLSHRENNMTKGSFMSETAYDLDRLGEWQQLGCTFTVPENTNQAYLAVNTQSKEAIDVVMYVDDWRLVPIEAPAIFDPEHVLVDIAAGNASATVVGGRYHVWSQALTNAAGATLGVSCGGANAGTATVNADAWEWIEVGEGIDLAAGEHEIELTVADGIEVKAVCLTTDIAK
ncbi:MAG TPA: carbohydrate binding domain-containing protein, partial [Armatimonadota bacterium]|nr:carbohydrate binding domain-containing protein [Armatimonadota bacterium]